MLLLVAKAAETLSRYEHPNLGRLATPRHFQDGKKKWTGLWAADNDCFQGFHRTRYLKMLAYLTEADTSKLLWVTAPDVVADSTATLALFHAWEPMLHDLNLPIAFVGQDGLTIDATPWDHFEAFFVGGTTEWKMGLPAARLVREAKKRGKWAHMGRVNSVRRIRYASAIRCDSVDGKQFSGWTDTYLRDYLVWIGQRQEGLAL